MPLSESSLIYTFRGWMLQSLDFKPSVEWYRLAKCHLREITPIRESLVWWQCLSSDSNLVFGKENSHPTGQCGAWRRPYVAHWQAQSCGGAHKLFCAAKAQSPHQHMVLHGHLRAQLLKLNSQYFCCMLFSYLSTTTWPVCPWCIKNLDPCV